VGSVFAVLSRYAVNFWNQGLHQGASLSLDKQENVSDVFWLPLLVCIAGFVLLFITLVLMRTRTEIRARRLSGAVGAGEGGVMPDLGKYAVAVLGSYAATDGADRGAGSRQPVAQCARAANFARRGGAAAAWLRCPPS
jgi:H+/Cl- antiporter ClcA